MSQRCDQCRNRIRGQAHETMMRTLCQRCYVNYQGAAAGLLAGNGNVGQAIATQGWFASMFRRDKKKP